ADRSKHTPIDAFLLSLAEAAGERDVAVILSGTASDGAIGLAEVKRAGGITVAQSPETAKYDGMPRAAIGTGMVDVVLSPQQIAEQITEVRTHPYHSVQATAPNGELPVTDAQLREIYVLLRRASGIEFKQYKTPTIK